MHYYYKNKRFLRARDSPRLPLQNTKISQIHQNILFYRRNPHIKCQCIVQNVNFYFFDKYALTFSEQTAIMNLATNIHHTSI